jgi:hypothetical protein
MQRTLSCLIGIACLLVASSAAAQSSHAETEGRAHFDRGLALFNSQDFNGALAEFQAAYDVSHRPTVLYNIGVAHQALHHYPEAARAIEQFLREATITPERRAQVAHGLDEIRQFIAHVTITGLPNGATLTIDGDAIGTAPFAAAVAVGTGRHTLAVHASGFRDAQQTILIAGGQQREVRFSLESESATTSVATTSPTNVRGGSIEVRGAPDGAAVEIDGTRTTSGSTALAAGEHRVHVRADGYRPWTGTVRIRGDEHAVARANLARAGRIGPMPVVVAASATALAGVATIVLGVVTLQTHQAFLTRQQESPDTQSLESAGNTERDATNVLLGATIAGALVSGALLFRTTFGPTVSRVDVAAGPGAVGVRVRF